MSTPEPRADHPKPAPHAEDREQEGTGLASFKTWNNVYLFVVAVFILWVVLLRLLTRVFS